MDARQRTLWGRRLYSRLPLVGGWLRLRAVERLARDDSSEAVRLLAEAVARSDDRRVCVAALEALQEVERPRCVEAVCEVWAATRHVYLEELLTVAGWVPKAPPAVRVLYQLVKDQTEEAAAGGAEVVEPLLRFGADADTVVAQRARAALGRLHSAEARAALCRLVIDRDDATAREVALASGFAPREAGQRALFYFLTGQWDAYESLDYDRSLLRAVYQAADPPLRQRIANRAREAGRVEWVEVVTGGRQQLRLGEMTDAEWQATLEVLVNRGQWAELWRLAQEAPPRWAARLLQQFGAADGLTSERAQREELVRLARAWREPNLALLVRPRPLTGEAEAAGYSLAISPDSRLLAAGGEEGLIRIWSLPDGQLRHRLQGHAARIHLLAISPRGRVLVSADQQRVVRFWGLPDGIPFPPLPRPAHSAPVACLAIGGRGKVVASGDLMGTIWLWDLSHRVPRQALKDHRTAVTFLAITPDDRLLISGGGDNTLSIWGLNDGRLLHTRQGHDWHPLLAAVIAAEDLLISSSALGEIRLWRLPDGIPVQTLQGHVGAVSQLAVAPSGRLLASGGHDMMVRLWGLPEGRLLQALAGHIEPITALAFSPDGQVLASCSMDGAVELWGLPDGRSLGTLAAGSEVSHPLAISPDGLVLATATGRGVLLWTAELARLSRVPAGKLGGPELAQAQADLADTRLSAAERAALEFIVALARWRRRFDIYLDDAPRHVAAGEFDIILAG